MSVNFQHTTVRYPLDNMNQFPLQLMLNGHTQAVLNIDSTQVLTLSFESIRIQAAMQLLDFDQNPPAAIGINPGSIAVFTRVSNTTIVMTYSEPGQTEQQVFFVLDA